MIIIKNTYLLNVFNFNLIFIFFKNALKRFRGTQGMGKTKISHFGHFLKTEVLNLLFTNNINLYHILWNVIKQYSRLHGTKAHADLYQFFIYRKIRNEQKPFTKTTQNTINLTTGKEIALPKPSCHNQALQRGDLKPQLSSGRKTTQRLFGVKPHGLPVSSNLIKGGEIREKPNLENRGKQQN